MQNRSKCYLGVYFFLVVKLLDTICLSVDLFSNDISLRYISSMDAKAGVYTYGRCCLHYIFIDQIRARPDRDGGLAEAYTPKTAMETKNL